MSAVNEFQIRALFNAGRTYVQIAEAMGLTKGVVAGRCRKLGLVRNPDRTSPRKVVISAEEQAERELDQRDIDILCDLHEGHSQSDCAKHWNVSKSYVQKLAGARSAA